jgi:hypothetical protein
MDLVGVGGSVGPKRAGAIWIGDARPGMRSTGGEGVDALSELVRTASANKASSRAISALRLSYTGPAGGEKLMGESSSCLWRNAATDSGARKGLASGERMLPLDGLRAANSMPRYLQYTVGDRGYKATDHLGRMRAAAASAQAAESVHTAFWLSSDPSSQRSCPERPF